MCNSRNESHCPIGHHVDMDVMRADCDAQKMLDIVQGLEGRLNAIRMGRTHSASGRSADPQVQAYSPLDDSSSDSDEDED